MKTAVILFLAILLLSGCVSQTQPKADSDQNGIATAAPTALASAIPSATQKPTATPRPSATNAPVTPKLNLSGPIRSIHEFMEDPGWSSVCEQTCVQTKQLAREAFCSLGSGDYFTPFQTELGLKKADLTDEQKIQQYAELCNKITPEIIFDCEAFQKGILTCGNGLAGCQNGGFWLQFNRTQVISETGYDVEPIVFVNSTVFKDRMERKGCPA